MFPVSRLFCILMLLQHLPVSDGCMEQGRKGALLSLFRVKTQDDPDKSLSFQDCPSGHFPCGFHQLKPVSLSLSCVNGCGGKFPSLCIIWDLSCVS